jgi:hypothetical protein
MFVDKWIITAAAILIFALLIISWKSRKQVRALRFCFLNFSDSVKKEIDENQYLLDRPDDEVISGIMKGFNRTWGSELDRARGVMSRANLRWFSEQDKFYALEDK